MKKCACLTAILAAAFVAPAAVTAEPPSATAAASKTNIYSGYSKAGYASRSSSSKWNMYADYSKVGYVQRSGDRWNVYEGSSKIGYSSQSGSKYNVYADYSKVGYAQGPNGGVVAAAALLLEIV